MARGPKKMSVFPASMSASRVKTPMTANTLVIREYANRVESLAAGEAIPATLGLRLEAYVLKEDDHCPPVIVAMRRLAELRQGTWKQWIERFTCVTLYVRRWRKMELYWCANRYFFVETSTLYDYVRASVIFNTRDEAMLAHDHGLLTWIDYAPIEVGITKVPSVS